MDQFGLLSLEDNDHEDSKLNSKILNLSLTDTTTTPNDDYLRNNEIFPNNDVITSLKEMTGNFHLDNNGDDDDDIIPEPMEIDLEDTQTGTQEIQSNLPSKDEYKDSSKDDENNITNINIDTEPKETVNEGSPQVETVVDDFLSDVESVHSKDAKDADVQNSQALTTVSKLLSPTQLGASLVTNHNNNNNNNNSSSSGRSSSHNSSTNNNCGPSLDSNIINNYDMIRSNNEIWKQLLTDKQLINVNINNHNYFHPGNHLGMGLVNSSNNNSTLNYPFNENLITEKIHESDKNDNLLPSPWSPNSTPYFKKWYDTISYVQWLLNFGSIVFIIYLVMSSMTKDLKAIWYQNKLLLINESQNCQLQYNLNDCDINFKLPEMSEICQDWWICWHRDNSKLINNRTNLLIKFLTSLINEFFTELNIKTLIVTVVLIFGWFFVSNFTMGFIRAKSYYGNGYKKG